MPRYLVSWVESRVHYVDVVAKDEFGAIEMAKELDYQDAASDESSYDDFTATLIENEEAP